MQHVIEQHYRLKPHQLAVVGITQNGKRSIYGVSADGDIPDAGKLVFEIGSVTKVFTAILFSQFIQEGKVGLHDPLKLYIPNMTCDSITLHQLATHTSGLPRDANNMKMEWKNRRNPFKNFQVEDAYTFIEYFTLKKPPTQTPKYSNIGMAMLGNVLAAVAGSTYEELLQGYILAPLGMKDTFITFDEKRTIQEVKAPINQKEFYPRFELYGDAPAGAIKSTVDDLLLFLEMNMDTHEHPLTAAMNAAHMDQQLESMPNNVRMALGWMLAPYGTKKTEIITHGGTTLGFNTHIGFSKEHQTGVVVFDNIHIGLAEMLKLLLLKKYTKAETLAEHIYEELL